MADADELAGTEGQEPVTERTVRRVELSFLPIAPCSLRCFSSSGNF